MRDFFNETNTGSVNIASPQPVILDEPVIDERLNSESTIEHAMRPAHPVEDEESSNLPKLVGAAVVAVLVVGGGIYAYQSTTSDQAKPAKHVAKIDTAKMPDIHAAVPVENDATMSPAPMKGAQQEALAPATPVPSAPIQSAAPVQSAPVQSAKVMTPGVGIGPTDNPALDAPMTFTMENAPAPQKEGSSARMAAEAPAVSAGPSAALRPNAPVNSAEPTPFVAPQTPSLPQ